MHLRTDVEQAIVDVDSICPSIQPNCCILVPENVFW